MIAQIAMSTAGRSVEVHTVGTEIRFIYCDPRTGDESVRTAYITGHHWRGDRFAGYAVEAVSEPSPVLLVPGDIVDYR